MTYEANSLLEDMTREITKHKFWGKCGFYGLQTMIWASIVSSAVAAFLLAIGVNGDLVAFLAGVPAFVLAAEAAFRYSDRYQYHDKAAAVIASMKNAYSIRKELTIAELSRWWDEYRVNGPQLPAPLLVPKKEVRE
jgi:hypothetical protein